LRKNWPITVNPLAASGKANVGDSVMDGPIRVDESKIYLGRLRAAQHHVAGVSKGVDESKIYLGRLRAAQHHVAGVSKANARFFKLTHRLETAS